MQPNIDEAVKWLKKAAELGNAEAMTKLGKLYYTTDEPFSVMLTKAYNEGYADAISGKDNRYAPPKKKVAKNVNVGDIVKLGRYPKNNGNTPEPIEWRVLKVENSRALVISKYALDGGKPYNKKWESITWESCTLRKWLNNDFLNKAFSKEEQQRIILANVPAHSNPDYGTNPGNDTQDKIFLLSVREAEELFKNDDARICYTTDYAKKQGSDPDDNGRVWWWLRSPGLTCNYAASVDDDGFIDTSGNYVNNFYMAIRPAFYLNLNS